jgi:hypothetical protein
MGIGIQKQCNSEEQVSGVAGPMKTAEDAEDAEKNKCS